MVDADSKSKPRGPDDAGGKQEPPVKGKVTEIVSQKPRWLQSTIGRCFCIVIVIAAFLLQRFIFTKKTCIKIGPHKCTCGDVEFDLLIDGRSIRLGPKTFSPHEMELLVSRNGVS